MDSLIPFSQENMNEIFKVSPNKPNRVISRESSWLEFKESFGWASLAKYLRSQILRGATLFLESPTDLIF